MSAHFKMSEFSSPIWDPVRKRRRRGREPVPHRYRANVRKTQAALETIRAVLGLPVTVISGWRSVAYNRANKGRASRSLHLSGRAADIRIKGVSPALVYWVIRGLIVNGEIPRGGLACYPTFTHYDIRGYNARWRKAPKLPRSRAQ